MEELHKNHKEATFGWAQWVKELSEALADARRDREAFALRERKTETAVMALPGDLHNLAAPH